MSPQPGPLAPPLADSMPTLALEINLRWLLQTSQSSPFSEENASTDFSPGSADAPEPGQL